MKVKINLEQDQTPYEAEEELYKAMSMHRDGGAHEEDTFQDPAMQHSSEVMSQIYDRIYEQMLDEVFEVIAQEPI